MQGIWNCVQHIWITAIHRVCGLNLQSFFEMTCNRSSVLFYALENGGPASLVWGVSDLVLCSTFSSADRAMYSGPSRASLSSSLGCPWESWLQLHQQLVVYVVIHSFSALVFNVPYIFHNKIRKTALLLDLLALLASLAEPSFVDRGLCVLDVRHHIRSLA